MGGGGQAWRLKAWHHFLFALCFLLILENVSSDFLLWAAYLLLAAMLSPLRTLTFWNHKPNINPSFFTVSFFARGGDFIINYCIV